MTSLKTNLPACNHGMASLSICNNSGRRREGGEEKRERGGAGRGQGQGHGAGGDSRGKRNSQLKLGLRRLCDSDDSDRRQRQSALLGSGWACSHYLLLLPSQPSPSCLAVLCAFSCSDTLF